MFQHNNKCFFGKMISILKWFLKDCANKNNDLCHESGCHSPHLLHHTYSCTSPMDCISHHSLHSHIPIHHYTNPHSCHQSLICPDCLTTPAPHSHTHILSSTTSMQTLRSLCLAPSDISEHASPSVFLCFDPALLFDIFSVCCLPWPLHLPLLPVYEPLPVWSSSCLLIKLPNGSELHCLFISEDFANLRSALAALFIQRLPSPTMDSIDQLLHVFGQEAPCTIDGVCPPVPVSCLIRYRCTINFCLKTCFISGSMDTSNPSLINLCFLEGSLMAVWGALWTMPCCMLAPHLLWVSRRRNATPHL